MDDLISRQAAIDAIEREKSLIERPITETRWFDLGLGKAQDVLSEQPSAQQNINIVQCKDCIFGHRYFDVQNGETDSWVECTNPDGLNRDVSDEGYCSAGIRRGKSNGDGAECGK